MIFLLFLDFFIRIFAARPFYAWMRNLSYYTQITLARQAIFSLFSSLFSLEKGFLGVF
jgi:hypothetical protein